MTKEEGKDYIEKINQYLEQDFFDKNDRRIAFLVGRYYNTMAYKEKEVLRTSSLTTKLPVYTKRLDKEKLIKVIDKCNDVAKRLESKLKKAQSQWLMREIGRLIASDDWSSTYEELSLAFMMGYTFFAKKENKEEEELQT